MKWSTTAWKEIAPIFEAIKKMAFIEELRAGTLPLKKFQYYIKQDAHYLEHFGRALALIAARATRVEHSLAFMQFAEGAILVENEMHQTYFGDFGISDKGEMGPTCHHYIHFLKSTSALDAEAVAMAAVLPCFWIYKEIGDFIYANQKNKTNPYQKWIDTYAGEEFGAAVNNAIAICDQLAAQTTDLERKRMTEAFIIASRLEFEFWDSAYSNKSWHFSEVK